MKSHSLSIQQRFDIFMPKYLDRLAKSRKYQSISNALSFSSSLSYMARSLGVVVDNTDAYTDCGKSVEITRQTPDGDTEYAYNDLDSLTMHIDGCIEIIDMLRELK